MKNRKLLLLVLLLLGALAIYLYLNNQNRSTIRPELKDFAIADTASIGRVVISDKQPSMVDINRIDQKGWLANKEFRIRQESIDVIFQTMIRMRVKSPVGKAMKDKVVGNIAARGKKVSFYNMQNELIKTLYIGGATPDNLGTFAMLEGADSPYIVYMPGFDGYLSTRFFSDVNLWQNRTILSVDNFKLAQVAVNYPALPAESFTLNISGPTDFVLLDKEGTQQMKVDTLAVQTLASSLRNVTFEGIVSPGDRLDRDSILNSVPFAEVSVTDINGKMKTYNAFRKANTNNHTEPDGNRAAFDIDRFYAEVAPGKLAVCQYFVHDRVLKTISDLKVKN